MAEVLPGAGIGTGPFTVVTQQRSTLVRSPTVVEDVEIIGVVTSPSNVYFERAVPYQTWQENGAAVLISQIAQNIENVLAAGQASSAWFTQDIDPSGLIVNEVTFQVTLPPTATQYGPMTTNVAVTVQDLYQGTNYQAALAAALASLKANAGQ